LNFSKKENNSGSKKSEDINKFVISPPSTFEPQNTNPNPFSKEFNNFSKPDAQKQKAEFDFNSFDFGKFGSTEKPSNNEFQPEKNKNQFPDTDFASLGKFSITALKKPPTTAPQITHSANLPPPKKIIDCI